MLITLTELSGLTSHLFALLSGVEEAVRVSTVTPPVPAPIGVDRVHSAVFDLGWNILESAASSDLNPTDLREHHHNVVCLGQREKSCPLNVAVAQPASLHTTAVEVDMEMAGELTIRTAVWRILIFITL